jgi:hypothetical protein
LSLKHIYRYERTREGQSAVLRRDLEGCSKAHQESEYTANSWLRAARDEFDRYIEESEKVLKKDCRTSMLE